ncbi:DUF6875 domain-containing protein [Streptomyces enissocaesilis]|uniref:DUF6875 domain-containing protein n=1 Tax=Streptomyces enissocaesilis TaxID=332589 RepID=A0ABN3X987_9ACTN
MTASLPSGGRAPAGTDGPWVRVSPPQPRKRVDRDLARIDDWLRSYVGSVHPELGRRGPVCPFVPPALSDHAVQFSLRYEIDGLDGALLHRTLEAEIRDFVRVARPVPHSGTSLESRVVALPDTGPEGWRTLDQEYEALKNKAVDSGLMIGQFHPHCDERAVRNPAFRVSVAPLGVLAIRRMAPHDVLFLHDRRNWFGIYDRLFRSYYQRGRIRDPLLRRLHRAGVGRHGLPPVVVQEHEKEE